VLHVIDSLQSGGAERYLATLVPQLTRDRRAESVVRVGGSGNANPAFVEAIRTHAADFAFMEADAIYDPRRYLEIARAVHRFRIDVVHSHLNIANATSRLIAAALRKPHVATIQLAPYPIAEDARRRVLADGATARLSTRVVGVSPQTADVYASAFRVPRRRMRVILNVPERRLPPPNFDRAEMRKALAGDDDVQLVCTLCRLEERKGIADLIAAVRELRVELPRLRVVVAGVGPDESRLRQAIQDAGVEGIVRLLGYREDVGAILAASEVFCLPSHHEGLPVSVLEAMLAGVPCVATDAGGTGHVVRDGETGLLVPPKSPGALAQALRRILTNEALARRVRDAAGRLVAECCTKEVVAGQYGDLYDELVSGCRRA